MRMIRAMLPYLALAFLIAAGAGVAYGLGAPAWTVYAATLVAILVVIPGVERWDSH